MARVLLVNPPIYDFAAYDLWAKPLGLLYVAAVLETLGHEARIVDCLDRLHPCYGAGGGKYGHKSRRYGTGSYHWSEVEKPVCYKDIPRVYKRFGLPGEVFQRELAAGEPPDIIGVTSGMTYWYGGVAEAVEAVRRVFPGVPVALGGIYATLSAEHAERVVRPDYLVRGPGEKAMAQIAAEVQGCAAPEVDDFFGSLPFPAYHLLGRVESVSILTGRGCPYHCAYCASGLLSRGIERRRASSVEDEIERYKEEFEVRDVAFFDDALLWDASNHIKPILRDIIRRGLGMRFHTPNGLAARMIDEEIAALMKEAGFVTLRLSLETVSSARQADWDGKVGHADFIAAVGRLRDAGFSSEEMGAYVMTGLPDESVEETTRAIAAAHAAAVAVRLAQYSPIPGTAYFERLAERARAALAEPLLQNNTAAPVGSGPYERYEALKTFAARLNDELAAGRVVFTTEEALGGGEELLHRMGIEI